MIKKTNIENYIYFYDYKMEALKNHKTFRIIVTGLVQGVGFRPFIFRIAKKNNLSGWVQNTNENVRILVTGTSVNIDIFLNAISAEAPPAAMIEAVSAEEIACEDFAGFTIKGSNNISEDITEISPDIAVCKDCLKDIEQNGSRLNYAFVNCTNCGPRFTIIQDLPYDRAKTTMNSFEMCPDCRNEYQTITDRRFHAQPTACSKCGPKYEYFADGKFISDEITEIIDCAVKTIDGGGVLLIKGLGGMHLACNAFNETAVNRLRNLKNREGKPFAVMFKEVSSLLDYAEVDSMEMDSLLSWRRPIVLLQMKEKPPGTGLAAGLNAGLNLIGVMLPYMPIHYLLFNELKTTAIVLTSGNFSSEPILTENLSALEQFSAIVDGIVLHNRGIFNRTDDSVVRIIGTKERVFRRSRGFAPSAVRTGLNTEGILAFGAELTNCFCIGKGQKAFLSQHIGDLQGIETTQFYENTINQFIELFRLKPTLLAADMHPAYISTQKANNFAELSVIEVQHHHAHIASCMAEYNLDEKVIGVAFDGTGYGSDGNIWGSEFMICDLHDFERLAHFDYVPLPGGDMATEEPWRIAVSFLYKIYGIKFMEFGLSFLQEIDPEKIRMLIHMIDKKINCPLTSGAGRLFDAVASILGLVQFASFQAEGPMRLESIVKQGVTDNYKFDIGDIIEFDSMFQGILEDLNTKIDVSEISAKFHNTIIFVIFEMVNSLRRKTDIGKVVLSGGVFQNKYLLEGVIAILVKNNFEVYSHAKVPTNDGGIALGQLAVASKRRELKCV